MSLLLIALIAYLGASAVATVVVLALFNVASRHDELMDSLRTPRGPREALHRRGRPRRRRRSRVVTFPAAAAGHARPHR